METTRTPFKTITSYQSRSVIFHNIENYSEDHGSAENNRPFKVRQIDREEIGGNSFKSPLPSERHTETRFSPPLLNARDRNFNQRIGDGLDDDPSSMMEKNSGL